MIDFYIIWKNVHGIASEEEYRKLKLWMDENPEHEKYYYKIEKLYQSGKIPQTFGPEIEKSWKKLDNEISYSKRNRFIWGISGIAATVSILLGLFFFTNIFVKENTSKLSKNEESKILEVKNPNLDPGSKRAILVLDDGTEYNLTDSLKLTLKQGNTQVKGLGKSLQYSNNIKNKDENLVASYNILKIPRGGEYFVILSDSSKIWLNSETQLRYPVEFLGNERIVQLEGEAYFEVAKSKKPFKVITGEQVVEVLGTSFNISSYREDSLTFTTLVEGKVKVYLEENPEIQQTLYPNHQSYVYKNDNMISIREVDPFPYIAWKEGRFYFKNKPLDEIMNTLSRWYNVNFQFENKELQNVRFTGDIERYESLDKILNLIQQTNELTYEFTDNFMVNIK